MSNVKIILKYKWFILAVTLLATIFSFVYAYFKPPIFDTSISFAINRINKQKTAEYQYDDYYAIQASDLFSQTVMSWFMTPSVLLEIYDQAGVDPQITSIERFTSRFKTKKYSPQNIVVRFKERDKTSAEKISNSIISIISQKAAASNQDADKNTLFEVKGAKPVIVEKKLNIWLSGLIGLLGGLIISMIVSYLIEYFKESQANQIISQ